MDPSITIITIRYHRTCDKATHRTDPANLAEVTAGSYKEILVQRRRLMAAIMQDCFQAL